MPTAAMTSMSGEEKARTTMLLRWKPSQRRLASSKRSASQRSMPKACTTRIPEIVSCTISAIWPMDDWPCTVARLSFLPSRITGTSVMGTAPKARSERRQSRTKQVTSMTITARPSRK